MGAAGAGSGSGAGGAGGGGGGGGVGSDAATAGAGVAGGAASAGAAGGVGASGEAAAAVAPAGAAPAPSPITASFTPTSTVSPSGTSISLSTPAAGEGTSESTLSVDTSKSGSSRSTVSPTPFIQRVIVPSVTVSPSCGIITSANVEPPSGQGQHRLAEVLGQRRVRLDELRHLFGEGLPVDGEVTAAQLFGDPWATKMHPEDPAGGPVGPLLRDDLHHALGVPDYLRPAVAAEGVLLGED